MRHFLRIEGAYQMKDSIDTLDMGEEGIAEAGTFGCPLDKTGDVDEVEVGGILGGWFPYVDECFVSLVRDGAAGGVRVYGAEGIVLGIGLCRFGKEVEKG
mmetsp:Transcript_24868/g.47669  ORF Transcript_24868/g.47669 Transcript_24868/m.47669 type:complete len:100 (+) Transcript_24868:799-1098(+)